MKGDLKSPKFHRKCIVPVIKRFLVSLNQVQIIGEPFGYPQADPEETGNVKF